MVPNSHYSEVEKFDNSSAFLPRQKKVLTLNNKFTGNKECMQENIADKSAKQTDCWPWVFTFICNIF